MNYSIFAGFSKILLKTVQKLVKYPIKLPYTDRPTHISIKIYEFKNDKILT